MLDREERFELIENQQSELKKLTHHLAEMESQLALIFQASPDMIVFLRKDGTIIKLSESVEKILGYKKDELIGRSIWEFIHIDDIEKTKEIRASLLKETVIDRKKYFINRWLKKNGTYAKLSWRFTIYDKISDHEIGFATDITHMFIEDPNNFRLIHRSVELVKDGIIITDFTDRKNSIIYTNQAFCDMCGYTKEEILGKNPRFLQSDESEQCALSTIRNSINNGYSCDVLLKNFKKDRSIFFNHLYISPIIDEGVITNYIGVSRDLTKAVQDGHCIWDKTSSRGFGKVINI